MIFKAKEKIFYIDMKDGQIREGKFVEEDNSSHPGGGIWVKLNGEAYNTFVYSEKIGKLVFSERKDADEEFSKAREEMKSKLVENNRFIDDVYLKLSESQGKLYAGILREILQERIFHE